MEFISEWSPVSISLRHKVAMQNAFKKLAGGHDVIPLEIFSETLEQAQYYHRQHEKSVYASYSKNDELDLFVDALPPENLLMREMDVLISSFFKNGDLQSRSKLLAHFSRWRDNHQPLQLLLYKQARLLPLKYLAEKVNNLSELALMLITKKTNGELLTIADMDAAKMLIDDSRQIDNELIIAITGKVDAMLKMSY
ncbi:MAG: hypothetical protein EOO07_16685 [Chitinophagaceae bacterium]|nr:MAG: hypothetical protein EOO07_16685 [Chitinophagaceae bacterium]